MKRSGFRKQSIEEVKEKQASKRLKAVAKTRKATKSTGARLKAGKVAKRSKLPSLKVLRGKADALLTPNCKKISPNCESCGQLTQVGHHWIEKSRSAYLRYDMRNLIALCNSCHAKIHNRFGNSVVGGYDVADKIISQRGRDWKEQLDIDQVKYQKVDRFYYQEAIERLTALLNGTSGEK